MTVGRDESLVILRKCLAMGADEAVLIKDPSPETYDGLRTARIIARFVQVKFPKPACCSSASSRSEPTPPRCPRWWRSFWGSVKPMSS